MNFNINTFNKFHAICIIPENKIKTLNNKLSKSELISMKWKLILENEGSFTKTLQYLTNNIVKTRTLQKQYNKFRIINRHIRCVWLETEIYTQLTFARSLWILLFNNHVYKIINKNKAIGSVLVDSQIDIYKKIHEVYYGYCQNLEIHFKYIQPIWGRKYTLYYNQNFLITIQEFFSPYINNFFYNT